MKQFHTSATDRRQAPIHHIYSNNDTADTINSRQVQVCTVFTFAMDNYGNSHRGLVSRKNRSSDIAAITAAATSAYCWVVKGWGALRMKHLLPHYVLPRGQINLGIAMV